MRVLLLCLLTLTLWVAPVWAQLPDCDYYAANNGGGNGLSPGSPYRIIDFINNHAVGGNTLCLMNGEYKGPNNLIYLSGGPSGSAGAPITIRALNDGQVWLNGEYTHYTFYIDNGVHHWEFHGLNFAYSGYGAGMIVDYAGARPHHITVKRSCFFNANVSPRPNANQTNLHGLAPGGDFLLFEDICIFGWGRNNLVDGNNTNTVYRRIWARWEGGDDGFRNQADWSAGGPEYQFDYSDRTTGGHDSIYENMIGIWSAVRQPAGQCNTNVGWMTRSGLPNPDSQTGIPGNLFAGLIIYSYTPPNYGACNGANFATQNWTPNRHVDHLYEVRAQPQARALSIGCDKTTGGTDCTRAPVDRITTWQASNQTGSFVEGAPNRGNIRFCTDLNNCPNPFTGESRNNSGVGGRLCHRYENGVLQDGTGGTVAKPLWPWPMDKRVKDALAWDGAQALGGVAGTGYEAQTVTSEIVSRFGDIYPACLGTGTEIPPETPTLGTFYLAPAPTGNDTHTCDDAKKPNGTNPKATLASVFPCMAGGSTLQLAAGTYAQNFDANSMPIRGGADWDHATVITAATGATVTFAPTGSTPVVNLNQTQNHYVIFDRLVLDAQFTSSRPVAITGSAGHVRIQNSTLKNSSVTLLLIDSTSDNEIYDSILTSGLYSVLIQGTNPSRNAIVHNTISDYIAGGIYDEFGHDTRIERNVVHSARAGSTDAGITVDGAANDRVINNIVWGTLLGIQVRGAATNTVLYHNTLTENAGKGFEILAAGGTPSNTEIRNTIVWANGATWTNAGTGTVESHTLITDPKFADPANHDYRLTNLSTGARNAGLTLASVTNDQKGFPRPQGSSSDIGADEYAEIQSETCNGTPINQLTGLMGGTR